MPGLVWSWIRKKVSSSPLPERSRRLRVVFMHIRRPALIPPSVSKRITQRSLNFSYHHRLNPE